MNGGSDNSSAVPESPGPVRKRSWTQTIVVGRNPRRTLIRVIVLVAVSFVVFRYLFLPIRIAGISMVPAYRNEQINFVNRLSYWRSEPQRGDVVSIRYTGFSIMLMKRIVGLPGERIAIENGVVKINGVPLDEPYVKYRAPWNRPEEQLGPRQYFVMGDNRSMPQDAHFLGSVDREKIVGKALF